MSTPTAAAACAIIPAFDEAQRIARVVQVAVASELFAEVLVVDDGSRDGTAEQAVAAGARVLRHERNRGKCAAMLSGLESTSAPVVCFLDADLLGITREHLAALVEPVVSGAAQAQLAVFSGGRAATTLAQTITPMISGQRCLRRELLDDFADWACGFGIETAINGHLQRRGVQQRIVRWPGAGQVMKEEKRGLLGGFVARLRMYGDILRTWSRSRR